MEAINYDLEIEKNYHPENFRKPIESKRRSNTDKTEEICRCIDMIVKWVLSGDNGLTAFNKAVSSYGLWIATEANNKLAQKFN